MAVWPCRSSRVPAGSPRAGPPAVPGGTLEPRFRGADENPPALFAPDHVVGRGRPDLVQVGLVQVQVASLAAPGAQHARADAAGVADLLIELEQFGLHVG